MNTTCPNCGGPLTPAFEVDNGVGIQTGGPWGCDCCHYVEPDPLEKLGLRTLVCKEMLEGDAKIIKPRGEAPLSSLSALVKAIEEWQLRGCSILSDRPCSACAAQGFCSLEESRDGALCTWFDPGPKAEEPQQGLATYDMPRTKILESETLADLDEIGPAKGEK